MMQNRVTLIVSAAKLVSLTQTAAAGVHNDRKHVHVQKIAAMGQMRQLMREFDGIRGAIVLMDAASCKT